MTARKPVILWRPDGEPASVKMSDPVFGEKRVKELIDRGYSKTKPAVTAEQRRAKEAKAKADAEAKDGADKVKAAEAILKNAAKK